jgi:hypothetical protein
MTGDSGHFVLDTTATAASVGTGGSTTFTVSFDPTTAGQKVAQVTFVHNDTSLTTPFIFEVTGLGTSVTPAPLVVVRETNVSGAVIANGAAPAGIRDFGSMDIALTPSAAVTIFVQNAGTATLTLGAAFATNSDFTVSGALPGTLAPGASGTFTVSFTPGSVGAKTASIQFTHDDSSTATPFSFQVTGTATSTGPGPGPGGGGSGLGGGGGGGGGCEVSDSGRAWWLLIIALGASLGARTWRRRANR